MQIRNPMVGLIVLMTSIGFASDPATPASTEKALRGFQGTWKITSLEADGDLAPAEIVDSLKFDFKDNSMTVIPSEPGFTNFEFRIDPNAKPAIFDLIHADGANKGKTRKGIYELKGDRLKICFGNSVERPTDFSTKTDSGRSMYTLDRKKP